MSGLVKAAAMSGAAGLITYGYHAAAKNELLGDRAPFFHSPAIAASAVSFATLFAHAVLKKPHAPLVAAISFNIVYLLSSSHQDRTLRLRSWGP